MRLYSQRSAPAVAEPEPIVRAPLPDDCPRHPHQYAPLCPECKQEAEQLRKAKELVSTRGTERSRRIDEGLKAYSADMARDLVVIREQHAARYLESIAVQCGNEARAPYLERVTPEIDAAMLAEALEEVKAQALPAEVPPASDGLTITARSVSGQVMGIKVEPIWKEGA